MGVKFNREGFVLMGPDGTLKQDSLLSAHSHKRVVPTGVLEAVPDTPGLFYRLTHAEAARLSKVQHKTLQQNALKWRASMTPDLETEKPKRRSSSKHLDELADTGGEPPAGDEPPEG